MYFEKTVQWNQRWSEKLKKINYSTLIIISILSFIGCMLFSEYVADFVFLHVTKCHEVVIRNVYIIDESKEINAKILDNRVEDSTNMIAKDIVEDKKYGCYDFYQLQNSIVDSNRVVIGKDSDRNSNYFELISPDSYITFKLPVYPNTCLTISTEGNKYAVEIYDKTGNNSRLIAYENDTEANSIKVYLYTIKDYLYIIVAYLIIYLFLFTLLFSTLLILYKIHKIIISNDNFFTHNSGIIVCFLIFISFMLFTCSTYFLFSNRLQVSSGTDAFYYMNPQILDENGHFSLKITADNLYTFRGYFTIVIAVIGKAFENMTGLPMIYFYFLFNGIIIAYTIGRAMPKLYEYFTEKKATNYMCISMFLLFTLFWNQHFYYSLTDIPAAMCAISATACILYGVKNNKRKEILISAFLFGVSISYRTAYVYIFAGIVMWCITSSIHKLLDKKISMKFMLSTILQFIICIMIITLPQLILNLKRGHMGFFPYDYRWKFDVNAGSYISLAWDSFTSGFHKYDLMGELNLDKQLAYIDQPYYINKIYSLEDLLYIIFTNPLQFCVGYFKRLFWAMSAGVEKVYGCIPIPQWLLTAATLINFAVIWKFILIFISESKKQILKVKDKILILLITIVSIGIQNLTHMERRYFLFYYLLIYFAVTFLLHKNMNADKKEINELIVRNFVVMMLFIGGCFIFYSTIKYNFL